MDKVIPFENKYKSSFSSIRKTSKETLAGVTELQKTAELLDSLKECIKEMNSSSNILYHTANESLQGIKTQCNILNSNKISSFVDLSELSEKEPTELLKGLHAMVEYVGVAAIHFAEETNALNDDIMFIDNHWKGLDKYVESYNSLETTNNTSAMANPLTASASPPTPPVSPSAPLSEADTEIKKTTPIKSKQSNNKTMSSRKK